MYEDNSHMAASNVNSPPPDATDITPDIVVAEGESVQSAVNRAGAGDVVALEAGRFDEQVVVDRGIMLQGAGTSATTIRAPPTVSARFEQGSTDCCPVVSIENDGAVVRNLTVDGDQRDVDDGKFVGIGSHNAAARVTDVAVRQVAAGPADATSDSAGIVASNADGTRRLVRIRRCEIREYGKDGIIGKGDGLDIDVSNCEVSGYGSTAAITQNGLLIVGVSRATIVGNAVRNNAYAGDQLAVGTLLLDAGDAFFAWNIVENNDCGIGGDGDGDIVARRNNIQTNDVGAVNRGAQVFDARKNWWGAADGPSTTSLAPGGDTDPETGRKAVGSGDAVYDVQWDPYSFSQLQLRPSGDAAREPQRSVIDQNRPVTEDNS